MQQRFSLIQLVCTLSSDRPASKTFTPTPLMLSHKRLTSWTKFLVSQGKCAAAFKPNHEKQQERCCTDYLLTFSSINDKSTSSTWHFTHNLAEQCASFCSINKKKNTSSQRSHSWIVLPCQHTDSLKGCNKCSNGFPCKTITRTGLFKHTSGVKNHESSQSFHTKYQPS